MSLKRLGWVSLHLPWWLSTLKQPARPASTVNLSLKFMKFLWGSIQGGGGGWSVWGLQGLGMGESGRNDWSELALWISLFVSFLQSGAKKRIPIFPSVAEQCVSTCRDLFDARTKRRWMGWNRWHTTGGLQTFVNKPEWWQCRTRKQIASSHVALFWVCKCLPPKE